MSNIIPFPIIVDGDRPKSDLANLEISSEGSVQRIDSARKKRYSAIKKIPVPITYTCPPDGDGVA